jgi:hypothetical protein
VVLTYAMNSGSELGPLSFPIYSERRTFFTSPPEICPIPRLRRPLRRREAVESTDPGVYIV